MKDGLPPESIIIGDKVEANLIYFTKGDLEVSFREIRPDGHIRYLPLYKARRAGVKKIYKALEKQEYDLPPFNTFRKGWYKFLKKIEMAEKQKHYERY